MEINVLHGHWRKKVHRQSKSVAVAVDVLINTRAEKGSL